MRRSMKTCAALVALSLVSACARSESKPPLAASAPVTQDEIFPLVLDGHGGGVWLKERAFADLLAGYEQEKGDLRKQLAVSDASRKFAEEYGQEMQKQARIAIERSSWLPILLMLGGFFAGGALVGVTLGVVKR